MSSLAELPSPYITPKNLFSIVGVSVLGHHFLNSSFSLKNTLLVTRESLPA